MPGFSGHEGEAAKVTNAINQLQSLIASNAPVWQAAQDYILFRTAKKETGQVVVWIEPAGTLMKKNKNTGEAEPYLIDGQPVEQSVSIKPEEDCGTVDMYFPVNASDIAGESLVVFEKLYYKGNVKALHEDINDRNQTVDIEAPDTGYAAKMSTGTTDTSHIEFLFISAFAMAPVIIYGAGHLLAKRKVNFRK